MPFARVERCFADAAIEKRDEARKRIASMTETERTRLKSDLEKFLSLPPAERTKLNRLAGEVQQDPELKRTMKEYLDFLEPLSAGEREDLHSEPVPEKRAALVRAIIKEQQDRADSRMGQGVNRRGLSSADLDSVLGVVETHLRQQNLRPKAQLDELLSKKGVARHVVLSRLAFRGDRSLFATVTPGLLEEMTDAISDPDLKERASKGSSRFRFWNIVGMTLTGIETEYQSVKPSEEKLAEFLARLSGAEQGKITRLPVDQQERALLQAYADAHPGEIPPPMDPRGPFGRGMGSGRPSGGERLRRTESSGDGNSGLPTDRRRGPPGKGKPDKQRPENPAN